RVTAALGTAADAAALAEALRPIVDERGSPHGPVPPGTPLLQPTDERRRTGSHYTPRSLTEPIVRHALEPAFARIGQDAKPEAVLALKVCDPAMGSGAFLVEACRQIAARLVAAWARHPGTRPPIAEDEDEDLLARRLVAQRCLYGVDRNPMATDLARLSLWLATLARDHEFTFLDHALKSGDSLVGLTRNQIGALTWGDDRQDSAMSGFVRGRLAEAVRARAEIRDAPDDVARAIQEARHRALEARMEDVRTLGDAVVACFFGHDTPREREGARRALAAMPGGGDAMWAEARRLAATLGHSKPPIRPFHWQMEFPEVFNEREGGFDAVIGNPPFLGGKKISIEHSDAYAAWLQEIHQGAHGNADLVAHFFRRAFALLRPDSCLGLVATNTLGQGDTRETGLCPILAAGGSISRASRRLVWPGEAAVVVSVVHIVNGAARSPVLDGQQVRRISAYLVNGDLDASPARLATNAGKSFEGFKLIGIGFTFDNATASKGKSLSLADMERLVTKDPRNSERIFPYLGGEEVNTSPTHSHHRYSIDFNDFPLRRETIVVRRGDREVKCLWAEMSEEERIRFRRSGIVPRDYPAPVAADWPDLLDVVERFVKPDRDGQRRDALRLRWWHYADKRPNLRAATRDLSACHILTRVSAHHMVTTVPTGIIWADSTTIFADERPAFRGILQSRPHELWAAFFASSLEDRLRYGPSDCFETFPVPMLDGAALHEAAVAYHDHRATIMVTRNEGLTKTYNRFHNSSDRAGDIQRLRDLHHCLDLVVLRAYGWDDLAARAAPEFLTEETEPTHRYQGRLFWPAPFRDEVLARLLDLNRARAAEERALGLSPGRAEEQDEEDAEAA
uniref:Eco57I restriction-modification methylase domain-containing protein n=1 Tax=Falsiroseomonas oryzae TaxID=2766473 RepID=UPI0022EA2E1C